MKDGNPFYDTKASLFTADKIQALWVDPPEGVRLLDNFRPRLEVPMYVIGGKGCGKTHLIRHCSFDVQRMRAEASGRSPVEQIKHDGYLGFNFLLGGLNAGRFAGKGQSADAWASVFEFSVEVWISQWVLSTLREACGTHPGFLQAEPAMARDVAALFNKYDATTPTTLLDVIGHLREIQRRVDIAVDNYALTGELSTKSTEVTVTRGRLTFGVPQVVLSHFADLQGLTFLYLIDEFENLEEYQQMYIATLARHQVSPVTLKVGLRRYGLRTSTHTTFSAREENKEGSEFVYYDLDAELRKSSAHYERFVRYLCAQRLINSGAIASTNLDDLASRLHEYFVEPPRTKFGADETAFVLLQEGERRYFRTLRRKLADAQDDVLPAGRHREAAIEAIINSLSVPNYPLLEKFNMYLFFASWARGRPLVKSAHTIESECRAVLEGDISTTDLQRYYQSFQHHRDDLLAALCLDYDQKLRYAGFPLLARLSDGFPRNLLMTLQMIVRLGEDDGELPFAGSVISERAQIEGTREASDWFFRDALHVGPDGSQVREAVKRLANLFRLCRFSDKPTEASVIQFSVELSQTSARTQHLVNVATQWSLLIEDSRGGRDRNSRGIEAKYRLNRMLCPRWDLSVSSKGTMPMTPDDVNAIFDPDLGDEYAVLTRRLRARLNAPGFARSRRGAGGGGQALLPGFSDD